MGFMKPTKPQPSKAQKELEASQAREAKRLDREEEMRKSALRRRRSGRSSLISGDNDAGIRRTLGGS